MGEFSTPVFYDMPSLKQIIFERGREKIYGYMFFAIDSDVKITVPESVKSISFLTFGNKVSMKIKFTGDCPQVVDGDKFDGKAAIYYNPSAKGWDSTPPRNAHTLING